MGGASGGQLGTRSGIIDTYTYMLMEQEKYRLTKINKALEEKLKKREGELHWTKVQLAKAHGRKE